MSNVIHLAGRTPSAFVARSHGPERKKDHASFSSRAFLIADGALEIIKSFTFFLICLFVGLVITGAVLSPFIYWKFFSLH